MDRLGVHVFGIYWKEFERNYNDWTIFERNHFNQSSKINKICKSINHVHIDTMINKLVTTPIT